MRYRWLYTYHDSADRTPRRFCYTCSHAQPAAKPAAGGGHIRHIPHQRRQGRVCMPTMRKLTPAEVAALESREVSRRAIVAEEYDRMLAGFTAGNIVEVELDPDDDRRTVRNRFKAAAQRRELSITFLPNRECILRFKLRSNIPRSSQPGHMSQQGERAPRLSPPRRQRRRYY